MRQIVAFLTAAVLVTQAAPVASPVEAARRELFAARYKAAAEMYAKALQTDASNGEAYCGLVRALIRDHRSQEAYAAAERALALTPQTAATQTAAGLAAYRGGDLAKAEQHFRSALRLDARHPWALAGLAQVHSTISHFKKADELMEAAYRSDPQDPQLILARANDLQGAAHVAGLREALALFDPGSEEAERLRAHIASDMAVGERKVRQLTSPYQPYRIELERLMADANRLRGYGLRVRLNQKRTVTLLLDTGASGISVSPKVAERAGLEPLSLETSRVNGIGDKEAPSAYRYLASEVRIGDLTLADYPVTVYKSAQDSGTDGIIGADIFARFLVTLNFPRAELLLEPRPGGPPADDAKPIDAAPPPVGAHRAFRFGNHLALPTRINDGMPRLFLVDSGASLNLLNTAAGREDAKLRRDNQTILKGIQGSVKQTSRADRASLLFAGFRQDNVGMVAIDLERMEDSFGAAFGGILGLTVLQHLKVTIDYEQGTIRLQTK